MRKSPLFILVLGIFLNPEAGECLEVTPQSSSAEDPPRSLVDFLTLAYQKNPGLAAARLDIDAAVARVDEAGTLPDPNLMIGVTNLALPEFSANMPASMAPMFQASQRFPLAGKRGIRRDVARLEASIEEAQSDEIWWRIRTEIASAYYDLFRIDREKEILGRTMGLMEDLETVALANYATGGGPQADVLRAGVARTRLEADDATLSARRATTMARLNRLVDRPASAPIPTIAEGPAPSDLPPTDSLSLWAAENHPTVQVLRVSVERAEARVDLAGRAIWPDLTVGFQYGLGRMDGGRRSMGGATVGFSVPIHAGKRQRRLHDEARARDGAARERLRDALNAVGSAVESALAELDRHRVLLELYQNDILPQARASVESSLAAYRVGEVSFSDLVDAQLAVNQFEGEYFDALASFGTALAHLEQAVGRTLSPDHELIKETP
jgi:outer membrane protein TolC